MAAISYFYLFIFMIIAPISGAMIGSETYSPIKSLDISVLLIGRGHEVLSIFAGDEHITLDIVHPFGDLEALLADSTIGESSLEAVEGVVGAVITVDVVDVHCSLHL